MKSNAISRFNSVYYSSLGVTCLAAFLKSERPFVLKRFFVYSCLCFWCPMATLSEMYTTFYAQSSSANKFLALSLGIDHCQIGLKGLYFLWFLKKFREIMLDFNGFNCVRHDPGYAETVLERESVKIVWCQDIYNFAVFVCFVSWTMVPVVMSPGALLLAREMENLVKILPPVYPFRTDYFPMGQIIYFVEVMYTLSSLVFFVGTSLYILTVLTYLCAMFDILNNSIQSRTGAMDLKLFIKDHQRLLRMCKEVRDLLSPVLAIQLLVSALTICFAIFEMTMVHQTNNGSIDQFILYTRKASYTIIIFIELVIFCWLSSELQASTTTVREGIYNSPWYFEKETKYREMIIISARALRPIKLTALYMVNLDLGTSLDVLRVAYSYYTMLKQMNK